MTVHDPQKGTHSRVMMDGKRVTLCPPSCLTVAKRYILTLLKQIQTTIIATIQHIHFLQLIRYSNGNNTQALKQFLESEEQSTGLDLTKVVPMKKFVALRPPHILPPQVL